MIAKINSFGIYGIDVYLVEIEVDISNGLPIVNLVGLPDSAIKESKDRVKSAIKNSGFDWPGDRITISLAPSHIKKEGPAFDLPIALGILAASGQINPELLLNRAFLGELALDGLLRPIKGALAISVASLLTSCKQLFVPNENAAQASLVPEIKVVGVQSLSQTVHFLYNPDDIQIKTFQQLNVLENTSQTDLDFIDIKGQLLAKRALEVAAAGAHNILMIGPPGSGKTMLAQRITTILPNLTLKESLETTIIHSVNNPTMKETLLLTRPFRLVHHTSSAIALVGGGSFPQPGEISLAHNGVLFLDELPEFSRSCLEALRQPLEDGKVRICRINRSSEFPSRCLIIATMNPCPCGFLGDSRKKCRCTSVQIQNYRNKISGPLLDRIDLHIELPALSFSDLTNKTSMENSKIIRQRVSDARQIQINRFKTSAIFCNAQMTQKEIRAYCAIDQEGMRLLKMAVNELGLSARGYDKILKIARTISDLVKSEVIKSEHIAEAIQYRSLDRG